MAPPKFWKKLKAQAKELLGRRGADKAPVDAPLAPAGQAAVPGSPEDDERTGLSRPRECRAPPASACDPAPVAKGRTGLTAPASSRRGPRRPEVARQ